MTDGRKPINICCTESVTQPSLGLRAENGAAPAGASNTRRGLGDPAIEGAEPRETHLRIRLPARRSRHGDPDTRLAIPVRLVERTVVGMTDVTILDKGTPLALFVVDAFNEMVGYDIRTVMDDAWWKVVLNGDGRPDLMFTVQGVRALARFAPSLDAVEAVERIIKRGGRTL